MKTYDAQATAARLPYPLLTQALRRMMGALAAGTARAPVRAVAELPGGALLTMPATDRDFACVKVVTVCAGNRERGLPSLMGEVILMCAATGERLLMLDGPTVTARRTAAVSALAAQTLARRTAGPLLIIGSGVQARAHLDAFADVLGVRQAFIVSRSIDGAKALAREAQARGVAAHALDRADEVLDEATLIVTATSSETPVLPTRVRNDAFIAAVGVFRPQFAELPPALVRSASLWVDDLPSAHHEAGDLIGAEVDWSTVRPLQAAFEPGFRRDAAPPHQPTVFKSVGHALWDLAAARLVHEGQLPA